MSVNSQKPHDLAEDCNPAQSEVNMTAVRDNASYVDRSKKKQPDLFGFEDTTPKNSLEKTQMSKQESKRMFKQKGSKAPLLTSALPRKTTVNSDQKTSSQTEIQSDALDAYAFCESQEELPSKVCLLGFDPSNTTM